MFADVVGGAAAAVVVVVLVLLALLLLCCSQALQRSAQKLSLVRLLKQTTLYCCYVFLIAIFYRTINSKTQMLLFEFVHLNN